MGLLKRPLAVLLLGTAVAAWANLMLTPVYHDGGADYPVWEVINWFMAASTLVALVVGYMRKREQAGEEPSVIEYLRVSFAFYGAVVLTMLFFWGWIWTLNPDSETGEAVTSHVVYFPIVDALFVVIALATGRYLWTEAGGS
ncbi:MAG: hypothetical protein OXG95_05780 [Chloroflexi bacterium]|nr:hypothetical protein [Chloroflexota bacterium]